ncbi:TadE family type IV pilus minor pilin [Streptomyces fragilis]|uniref:TadE family type IV pilus minor pilin n=1 Tax=Streptomyces fragilis TaxID=67301 RepID=A0ABV2YHT1_9ACTN|nr:TadE family type IV pilus minor pilin [Streptomyces fragilis]
MEGHDDARPARDRQSGMVTAETAVTLPVLVLFGVALVWALMATAAQIQCVDAARAGARAAARQDPEDAVLAVARRSAPEGASVTVGRSGGLVRVRVVAHPPGAGALPFEVRHEAVALAEETVGAGR